MEGVHSSLAQHEQTVAKSITSFLESCNARPSQKTVVVTTSKSLVTSFQSLLLLVGQLEKMLQQQQQQQSGGDSVVTVVDRRVLQDLRRSKDALNTAATQFLTLLKALLGPSVSASGQEIQAPDDLSEKAAKYMPTIVACLIDLAKHCKDLVAVSKQCALALSPVPRSFSPQPQPKSPDTATSAAPDLAPSSDLASLSAAALAKPPAPLPSSHQVQQQAALQTQSKAATQAANGSVSTLLACAGCRQPISPGAKLLQFQSKLFHQQCFVCGKCSKPISTPEFLILQNTCICNACSPSCHVCKTPVVKDHFSAFGVDYHRDCFRCVECSLPITNLNKFYRRQKGPCCPNCIEAVFERRWSPSMQTTVSGLSDPDDSEPPSAPRDSTREVVPEASPPPPVLSATASDRSPAIPAASNASSAAHGARPSSAHAATSTRTQPQPQPHPQPQQQRTNTLSKKDSLPDPGGGGGSSSSSNNGNTSDNDDLDMATLDSERSRSKTHPLARADPSSVSPIGLGPCHLDQVLHSDFGVDMLIKHCAVEYCIENLFFWLDVEQFRNFDGDLDDVVLYAKSIEHKYVMEGAELFVQLPDHVKSLIAARMASPELAMFDEAQKWVYGEIESSTLPRFLKSEWGKKYVAHVVNELNEERNRIVSDYYGGTIRAWITNFEKRHDPDKYYVYELTVERGTQRYVVYRRYSELLRLETELKRRFPHETFPAFPSKILFRRSQVRDVAKLRMKDINMFLEGMLSMRAHISNCELVQQFFRQSEQDRKDDEFNKRLSMVGAGRRPPSKR